VQDNSCELNLKSVRKVENYLCPPPPPPQQQQQQQRITGGTCNGKSVFCCKANKMHGGWKTPLAAHALHVHMVLGVGMIIGVRNTRKVTLAPLFTFRADSAFVTFSIHLLGLQIQQRIP
jgi:hypothetical protein